MHHDYTVAAARAGVHVLCEKPLAVTEDECHSMIESARENRVKLMTAYRLHFERANLKAVELVKSGRLGEPRIFDSVFTMQVKDEDNIRLQSERGGGPLYDIGIYCINAARYLFRAEPTEVVAFAEKGKDRRFSEVEEMVSVVMRFPGQRLASFTCSFGAADVSAYQVVGTKGVLRVDPAYEYAEDLRHLVTIGGRKREQVFPHRDQFAPELLYFSECVQMGKDPEPSGEEGLADVRVIRALHRSAKRGGEPIVLDEFHREVRPSLKQEIRRPPVRKPEMVHAQAPSSS
jgi:glucose-fructose oxidoreductase